MTTKAQATETISESMPIAQGPSERPGVRWWQTVRVRFALLLTFALIPWLILAALEAWETQDRDRLSQTQLQDLVASTAVTDIGQTLEAGRLGLDAAPFLISERGCELGAQEVLSRLGDYTALIVKNAEDEPTCQTPTSIDQLRLINPDPFSDQKNFRIEKGLMTIDGVTSDVVMMQSRIRSSGEVYTLVIPQSLGIGSILDATLGDDHVIALNKSDGRSILGMDVGANENMALRELIGENRDVFYEVTNDADEPRRVISKYYPELGVYVTVGRATNSFSLGGVASPYTTFLLPIFVWIVGFILIWLGTQTMLLRPLRKIELTTQQFARGKMNRRVALTGAAAPEVHSLAQSFNDMAQQLQDRAEKIADNLDEKDTLMREIHHRVKNNLQIIISLLNMQERKADSEAAIQAISETRTRINAIAIVHRGLYESSDLRKIDVAPFLERLIASLGDSLSVDEEKITITQDIDSCQLSADNAIPVALFIVEAMSNAVVHGVERGGNIHVEADASRTGRLVVEVSDDGRGVGDPSNMRGVGSRLMKGFARQISGELTFRDNKPGLVARLDFPIDMSDEQPFQVRRQKS